MAAKAALPGTLDDQLGKVLRGRREQLGLTMRQAALAAQVSLGRYQGWEGGTHCMSAPSLRRILGAFRLTLVVRADSLELFTEPGDELPMVVKLYPEVSGG